MKNFAKGFITVLTLIAMLSGIAMGAGLIISEVADPKDNTQARFVEIYNAGSTYIDLTDWQIRRYENGSATSADFDLSGSIAAGEVLVIAYQAAAFSTAYGNDPDFVSGYIDGNGDDTYELYNGSSVVDIYGEAGVDGTLEDWKYTNARAVRNSNISSPNTTWTSAEWTITADANVADMTPGVYATITAPANGDGSSGSPYEIGTLANLYWIAADTLRFDKDYIQTADIDASGIVGWTPIGYSVELLGEGNHPFTGSYEGQDYKISGLYINSSNPNGAALFGMTENADLLNIIMENVNITGDSAVAALVGWNFTSTITNCSSSGNITGNRFTGGLIGMNILGGIIDSCYSTCTVTSNITDVGGLAGDNYYSSTVKNSYSTGNVSGNEYCGGLIGDNTESTIENSFCTGNVSGTDEMIGGLVGGSNIGSLSNCYCTGNVKGNTFVGGLVGGNEGEKDDVSSLSNCYCTGNVEGNTVVGGLVGGNEGDEDISTIDLCYSSGHVSGNSIVGGMVGFNEQVDGLNITHSFWNTEISGLSTSDGGTGKTTVQMQTQTTYPSVDGWDFTTKWEMNVRHNSVYPYFQWQDFPPEPMVKTQTVLDTTVNSAMIVGEITSLGDTDPSQHGVCWNTTGDPDINDDKTMEGSADSAGLFTSEMTNLSYETMYYVKAYATNTDSTTYGDEISFTINYFIPITEPLDGDGSSDDPYEIGTLNNLYWIAVDTTRWDKHYIQTADIDASGTASWSGDEGWTPIGYLDDINEIFLPSGSDNRPFTGSYNGKGFKISGLYINSSGMGGIALFGMTENADLDSIIMETVNITGEITVSALVGWNYTSTITNCSSSGTVTGDNLTGGLISFNADTSSIDNCYSTCTVTGNESDAGGLVGMSYKLSTIENSYSTGNVSAPECVGGLIGSNCQADVKCSYCTGNVSGTGENIGGFIGTHDSGSSLSNCYCTGNVVGGVESIYVGGLTGLTEDCTTIDFCYSNGQVSGNSDVGGMIGLNEQGDGLNITNSFWNITQNSELPTSGSSGSGTGKTTVEMKTLATFTDEETVGLTTAWDFETNPNDDEADNDYWDMDPAGTTNSGYPFLDWENGMEIALPITLTSFTAKANAGVVELAWETATETNNACFVIYRDGEAIGSIDGAGTTSEPHNYSFVDNSVVPGVTYTYVLADIDLGNKETKYEDNAVTVTVANDLVEANFVIGVAYPNPFNPTAVVPVELSRDAMVKASLYDLNGREVKILTNATLSAGSHELRINGSSLSTGLYLVQVVVENVVNIQKIALIK